MTTFYERGAIRITEQWLAVGNHRYRTSQLDNLRGGRGPADRTTRRMALTAAPSLLCAVVVGPHLPAQITLTVVIIFVVLPAATAIIRAKLFPRPYLLWADFQRSTIQVYQGRDAVEFGKISRALVRATTLANARTAG